MAPLLGLELVWRTKSAALACWEAHPGNQTLWIRVEASDLMKKSELAQIEFDVEDFDVDFAYTQLDL